MSNRRRQKFKVLDEVFDDEYSNFDPDIADALSNLSEQMSETGQQDSVKIADSFHSHSNSQPSIQKWYYKCFFLRLSLTAER